MKSKGKLRAVLAAVGAFLLSIGSQAMAQAPIVLKLAHGATADQAIGKGMEKFAQLVKELRDGCKCRIRPTARHEGLRHKTMPSSQGIKRLSVIATFFRIPRRSNEIVSDA